MVTDMAQRRSATMGITITRLTRAPLMDSGDRIISSTESLSEPVRGSVDSADADFMDADTTIADIMGADTTTVASIIAD